MTGKGNALFHLTLTLTAVLLSLGSAVVAGPAAGCAPLLTLILIYTLHARPAPPLAPVRADYRRGRDHGAR